MTATDLQIRSAGPGDADLVIQFIRELAEYERLSDRVTARAADIADALGDGRIHVLIAEAGVILADVQQAARAAGLKTFADRAAALEAGGDILRFSIDGLSREGSPDGRETTLEAQAQATRVGHGSER